MRGIWRDVWLQTTFGVEKIIQNLIAWPFLVQSNCRLPNLESKIWFTRPSSSGESTALLSLVSNGETSEESVIVRLILLTIYLDPVERTFCFYKKCTIYGNAWPALNRIRKATFLRFNQLIKQHTVTKVMINGYNVQFKNLNTYILGENLFELYETLK